MTLIFNDGNIDQMMCVQIPIIDDTFCEGNEQFQVSLENIDRTNADLAPGRASGSVTIIDDDSKCIWCTDRDNFITNVACVFQLPKSVSVL